MYRHILIPTDGSELAGRAVRHGLALAKSAGAKVTALTVEPSFDVYTVPASRVYEMSGAFAEHAERAKAHAQGILDGVAEEARAAGVVCETVQVEHAIGSGLKSGREAGRRCALPRRMEFHLRLRI